MHSDYDALTVLKLKALCKERNLTVSGRKSDLIERLLANDSTQEELKESGNEAVEQIQEEKKRFQCSECPTILRVPVSYNGMVTCPTCSTRQDVSEGLGERPVESFELTAEQIGTALMIGGILMGVFAMWLILAEWNLWFSCELSTISGDEYEQLGCGQGTFFNTMFTSCCVLIPVSFLIGTFGYNYSESKNVAFQSPIIQGAGITPPAPTNARSPLVGAIQATAVGYGIGIVSLIGIVLGIIVLFIILILLAAASY